jgi:acetoin utilization deacetylase AcuC-like enzyme
MSNVETRSFYSAFIPGKGKKQDLTPYPLCLYLAGMDVFSGASNPHLRLGVRDIDEREDFVFTVLAERGIPVAYAHGGGYTSKDTNARLHIITARAASRLFRSYRKK